MAINALEAGGLPPANFIVAPDKDRRAHFYSGPNFANVFSQLRPEIVRLNHQYGGDSPDGLEYSTIGSLDSGQTTGAVILRNRNDRSVGFFTFQAMRVDIPRFRTGLHLFGKEAVPILHMVTFGVEPDYRGYNWAGKMVEIAIENLRREGIDVKFTTGITHKPETIRALQKTATLSKTGITPWDSPTFYKGRPTERAVMLGFVEGVGLSHLLDSTTGEDTGLLRGVHRKTLTGNNTDQTHPRIANIDDITINKLGVDKGNGDGIALVTSVDPTGVGYNVLEDNPDIEREIIPQEEERPLVSTMSRFIRTALLLDKPSSVA